MTHKMAGIIIRMGPHRPVICKNGNIVGVNCIIYVRPLKGIEMNVNELKTKLSVLKPREHKNIYPPNTPETQTIGQTHIHRYLTKDAQSQLLLFLQHRWPIAYAVHM